MIKYKNIYSCLICIVISLFSISCSDNKEEHADNIIINTTWTNKDEVSNIAILKIKEGNKILWSYTSENISPNYINGIYEGEYPFITLKIYSDRGLIIYSGYFKDNILYLYDIDTQNLEFKLEKKNS